MRAKEFVRQLEHDRVVDAIKAAEAETSAEVRVYVHRGELKAEPLVAAQKKFHQLGMNKTPERNAVLIFVAPHARKFAVIGDKGVHEKVGERYWQHVVDLMREHFQHERFSDALVDAIRDIGSVLARHFPRSSTSRNDLPDDVVEG